MFNSRRQKLNLIILMPLGIIFTFTSCVYSTKYVATYTVQDKSENIKETTINYINQLAEKNSLTRDTKYNGVDTLAFFGRPYHYFKFWFDQNDINTVVKLDYWGNYGSRKNKPYQDFFDELNNFIKDNFVIIEQDIKEENNSK